MSLGLVWRVNWKGRDWSRSPGRRLQWWFSQEIQRLSQGKSRFVGKRGQTQCSFRRKFHETSGATFPRCRGPGNSFLSIFCSSWPSLTRSRAMYRLLQSRQMWTVSDLVTSQVSPLARCCHYLDLVITQGWMLPVAKWTLSTWFESFCPLPGSFLKPIALTPAQSELVG